MRERVTRDFTVTAKEWLLPFVASLCVGMIGAYIGMRVGLAEANIRVDFLLQRVDKIAIEVRAHEMLDGHPAALEKHRSTERRMDRLEAQRQEDRP